MIKIKHWDSFAKNTAVMFIASSISSVFNLLYQLLTLRLVSPGVFASLNSLLSLLVIITVPAVSFTTLVAKHVSSSNARSSFTELKSVWRAFFGHALLFSSALFILILVFRGRIADFLKIDSMLSIIILGAVFFLSGISPLIGGALQGLERFGWFAAILVLGGISKLVFSYGLIKSLPHLEGALLGILISVVLSIAIGFFPIWYLTGGKSARTPDIKKLYFFILPATAVAFCSSVLTNIDMILVKHFFALEAQGYARAQMIGKIIFFIPGMIYAVMFSRVSGMHATGASTRNILKRSIVFTFILSFLAVVIYNLAPGIALKILMGSFNGDILLLGRIFSLTMFFYALSNILFYYQLSIERYGFIKPLIFAAFLQVILISVFHGSVFLVAGIALCFSVAIFTLNLFSALK